MRPRFFLLSALALGFVATQGSPALADPPGPNVTPLQVLTLSSEDAHEQATALSQALRSTVRASHGWSLPDREYSLEVLSLTLGCGDAPDPACQQRIADEIGEDRYLWGTVQRVPGARDVIVDLRLFDREQPGDSIQLRYNDNLVVPGDEALRKLADHALQKLTGGAPRGTVQLKSLSATGEILVNGRPAGSLKDGGANLRLIPGEHRVEVRGDQGFEAGTITVRSSETVQLMLVPELNPTPSPAPAAATSASDWRPIAGWVGLGVGTGLVLGGVYSAIQVGNIEDDAGYKNYRRGFASSEDVCVAARDGRRSVVTGAASPREVNELCDRASTHTTLQYVFFGAGAVAIGAGTYFLVSSLLEGDRAPASDTTAGGSSRFAVVPSFGPGVGAVDVHLTF